MKKFLSYIAGVTTGILLVSAPIFADSYTKTIEALVNFTNIRVNGNEVASDNFVVDGKTYVWIRDVANMLGKQIVWDESTNTADIVDEISTATPVATIDEAVLMDEDVMTSAKLNSYGIVGEVEIKNALEMEINNTVFLNQAAKDGFIVDEEIKASAKEYVEQLKGFYGDQFNSVLSSYGLTEKKYTAFIEKSFVLDKYSRHLQSETTFTDEQLKAKYDELADKFLTITAKHILIKTEGRTDEQAKAEIEKIAKELKDPKQFDEIMAKYSEDTGSKDLKEGMTFGKGEMVPEFENACLSQEVGAIGKPIKTSFGYHIVLVTDRKTKPLDEVKDICSQELFNTWIQDKIKQWRDASQIIINEDVLKNLSAE